MNRIEFKRIRSGLGLSSAELGKVLRTDGRCVRRFEASSRKVNSREIPDAIAALMTIFDARPKLVEIAASFDADTPFAVLLGLLYQDTALVRIAQRSAAGDAK